MLGKEGKEVCPLSSFLVALSQPLLWQGSSLCQVQPHFPPASTTSPETLQPWFPQPFLQLSWVPFQKPSTAWLYLASLGTHGFYHYPQINRKHKTPASHISAFPLRPLNFGPPGCVEHDKECIQGLQSW